jgi:predicted dehydrogenase
VRANGLHLVVGYTNQFTPGAVAARAFVHAGRLGEITLVSGLFTSCIEDFLMGRAGEDVHYTRISPIGGPSVETYADPRRSGGGHGQAQATHAVGMAVWITGLRARRSSALMSCRDARVDVIDAIVYELANGALGTLAASGALGPSQAEQQEQWYFGTLGTLHQDFLTGIVTLLPRDGGPDRALAPAVQTDNATTFAAPLDCLVDLVLGRSAENHGPAEAGVAAVELLEAAYASAANGGAAVGIAG